MKDVSSNLPMPVSAPLSQAQKTQILNLVRRAARAEIMPRFRRLDRGDIHTKADEMDLVTAADTSAEAMITRGLQMAFPNALVIGEEAVAKSPKLLDKIGNAELCFIIDPVDGTWNFAHGMPLFGTIIAATRFGQPVFGLIYDPVGDDAVMSDNTSPAIWQTKSGKRKPIHGRDPRPLEQMTGYMHIRLMTPKDQALMWPKVGVFAHAGALRCSAHEYRLLATGAVDFVMSATLNPWDHVAGALITQQAGGMSAMLDAKPYDATVLEGYLLTASSPETWDMLADYFAELLTSR